LVAVDRGDYRLGKVLDAVEDLLGHAREVPGCHRAERLHHGDVGAGDERLVAGAGDDDDLDPGIGCQGAEGLIQLPERRLIEGVEDLGTVNGDGGDVVCDLYEQVGEVHRGFSLLAQSL